MLVLAMDDTVGHTTALALYTTLYDWLGGLCQVDPGPLNTTLPLIVGLLLNVKSVRAHVHHRRWRAVDDAAIDPEQRVIRHGQVTLAGNLYLAANPINGARTIDVQLVRRDPGGRIVRIRAVDGERAAAQAVGNPGRSGVRALIGIGRVQADLPKLVIHTGFGERERGLVVRFRFRPRIMGHGHGQHANDDHGRERDKSEGRYEYSAEMGFAKASRCFHSLLFHKNSLCVTVFRTSFAPGACLEKRAAVAPEESAPTALVISFTRDAVEPAPGAVPASAIERTLHSVASHCRLVP